MGAILSYSLLSGLLLLILYAGYHFLLEKENQPGYNRAVLLGIYIISFTAIPISAFFGSLLSAGPVKLPTEVNNVEMIFRSGDTVSSNLWLSAIMWIFTAGMVIVSIKTLITWIRLVGMIRSGRKIQRSGFTLVVTEAGNFAPFSWMSYVVMSSKDLEEYCSAILLHERRHVQSCHWIDLLIAQAACIINWFNPAAWLMRDSLMLVHEYQADSAVIESGYSPDAYKMLLIKKAVGSRFPSLANSLNHSKLKKRITMMSKAKSGAGRKIRALALVPMCALAIGVASVPTVRAAVTALSTCGLTVSKDNKNQADYPKARLFKFKSLNNDGNETTVRIKGEGLGNKLTVSGGTFTTKGKTYQAKSLQCNMSDGVALITATFPFISEFENTGMTLTIDGEEIPFDLESFFEKTRLVVDGSNSDSRND